MNNAQKPMRFNRGSFTERVVELGYPEQALYERGYPHNNCGGTCILAGLGQWHGVYLDYPERFAYAERRERQFNAKHRAGQKRFTVLRDQSQKPVTLEDGTIALQRQVMPLTLAEFRERIERNDPRLNLRDFRTACGCMLGEQGNLFDLLDERSALEVSRD